MIYDMKEKKRSRKKKEADKKKEETEKILELRSCLYLLPTSRASRWRPLCKVSSVLDRYRGTPQ